MEADELIHCSIYKQVNSTHTFILRERSECKGLECFSAKKGEEEQLPGEPTNMEEIYPYHF